jgi:hypothetical protein
MQMSHLDRTLASATWEHRTQLLATLILQLLTFFVTIVIACSLLL